MPIDALYNAIRNAPNQQGWQAAQQREAASHQAAIDEAVAREQAAQQAQQLWNGYDYNAEAERRAQVGGYTPASEAFRAPTEFAPRTEYDPQEQARRGSAAWQPSGDIEISRNNRAAYIPGTQIEYGTERGDAYLALAAQRDSVDKAAEPFNPFKAMTAAGNARGALQVGAPAAKAYNALNDTSRAIGAEQDRINEFLNDEEYRADKAATAAAIAAQQRRENLDPTEAAWQLDQLKRQYEETKRIFASTNPDDLIVDTSEKLGRRDEILDNLAAQIAQLEGDLTARQNETRYAQLTRLPDFEQNSQYVPHERIETDAIKDPSREGIYADRDVLYEAVNGNRTAINQYNRMTGNSGNYDGLAYMTDDERRIYNYLYARDMQSEDSFARDDPETHGESGKYLKEILPTLNARMRSALEADIRAEAKAHPFAMSVASVLTSPLKAVSYASQLGELAATGKIDQNAAGSAYSYMNNAVRSAVSREIERNWGKSNTFAYNTAMSMADNLWQMFLTGGPAGEGAMLAIMGAGAAADTVVAAKDRGLTDAQAFALGTATGAIEVLTEKIGFDNLYNVALRGDTATLKALLSQTLAEGSEEFASSVLDNLADMIIAGTDSEHYRRVRALVASGMSETEAIRRAWAEDFGEAGMEALSGALSGMLMSGGGRALQSAFNAAPQIAQNIRDTREQNRVDEMVRMANEEAAQRYANLFKPQQTAQAEQTAAVPSETPANPAVSAPTASQTATDTATQTAQETPIQNGKNGQASLLAANDGGTTITEPQPSDTAQSAPAQSNTEQTLGNTVGSAETGFNYTEFPHEQKVSAQAETTMRYDPTRGRAAGQSQRAWRQALTYTTQSDTEVNAKADEVLDYADSYEGGVKDLMDDLRYTPGLWNAVESTVARRIGTRLEQESLAKRKAANEAKKQYGAQSAEYKAALEESKDAQVDVRDWNKLMRDDARGVARAMQIRTQWSGEGNEDGSRTERAAVRAIENNDNLSDAQKAEITEAVQNYMDDVRLVDEDVKDGSISEDEGKQNLIDIIVEVGRRRGTLANGVITRLVTANLSALTFEELKQAAFAEPGMLAFDKTAADPWQIVKTVQVLNMLSNPKTFATNVLSNTAFRGIDKLAMRGAALMDALLEKATGTRSVAWEDAVSRRIWDEVRHAAAKSIVEIALDIDMGGEGKYSPTGTQNFRAQGGEAALPVRAMRIWERNNNFALVLPDEIAKAHTRGSVARSMEKLTQEGRIRSKNVEHYAQTYADNLAAYRTFQNTRLASDITKGLHDAFNLISLSTIQQRNVAAERGETLKFKDIDLTKFGLGDLIAPFSKIGGNLVGVALDYSPVKFLTGIAQTIELLAQQHRAKVNNTEGVSAEQQARAVSNLGRGFTGTALSLGLYVLAKAGLIRRGKDEDPTLTSQQKSAVNSLNKAEGRTGTQINMTALGRWLSGKGGDWQDGDRLYDLSRFEPFNFFIDYALMLADNWDEADDFVSYVSGATQAVLDTMGNNVSDMPVFQSLSNFNNARSYGDKRYQAAISSLGKTAVSSSTPNILAAFTKGMDNKQRDLYTHKAEGTDLLNILAASALETFDYAKSRIPFLRETLPAKVGTDGKPLTNPGNTAQRLLNAMINPMGVNEYDATEATNALNDIYAATGDASFYPKVRSSTKSLEYTENGEKHTIPLDYEQRQAFQEAYSTAYWDVANAMVKLPEFKRLAPEEQAKALGKLEKYAYQKAKQPYVGDKHIDKWVRNASKNTTSLARWLVANR